ncbi:putative disease resistance protein RGA3 [Phoenix dactylifera]|uniref:Disease resistance protein RGA3 n=1 Tax=Phoenix dactylifera TaxID=42345 RepID=A0A8B7D581_PHODC|nr:putative disease resistance protein RGA3 [Phoenix dactylifera]XP_008813104.2 putative disease resistance protein RGA3 [Phoenix dactylifera]
MAELTIAGWLVSPIIEEMIHKARSYLENHHHRRMDMEEELHSLETSLTQILAVVGAAERRQHVKDVTHQTLLRQMKDAIYEAEDVLDEYGYLFLKARVEGGCKVSHRLSSCSLSSGQFSVGHGKFRTKLRNTVKKLDRVNASAERFLQVTRLEISSAIQQPEVMLSRATTSFLLENKVFGRDEERDEIIGLLLEPGDEHNFVLPVVGEGGVGKTTLAQLVYNDVRVAKHFELRMWICVSDSFNEIRLTREILASVSNDAIGDSANLNKLQEELRTKLMSRKYLLVLDDVWNAENMEDWENRDRWRKLLAPLRSGERGSKILATTRMEMVVAVLGAVDSIYLKGLRGDAYWLLFKKHAFGCENPDNHPDLLRFGEQIAERLNGSPLAAKVVGGMLNAELDIGKWKNVLKSDIWDGIMPVLRSSYQNLPAHLQRCFAYCSIFPKDWKFEPDRLVYMWMAQGFIQPQSCNIARIEDIGRVYFDDLLSRSFFQTLEQDGRKYYMMHDLMSDLAQTVSKDECFRIEGDMVTKIPSTVCHLSINTENLPQLTNIRQLNKLRTLVFFYNDHNIHRDLLKELKSIRVLDLTGCDVEKLPEDIDHLIHLRYLALCDTLRTLPASLCKLYHLQVLSTSRWCWLGQFPESMNKLISLRHLNVHSKYAALISGIGKLTCLQELAEFHVRERKGYKIGELKDMNELRGSLDIRNLQNVKSKAEAVEAKLNRKMYITALRLEWGTSGKTRRHDVEVLEGLQPNANLEELDIVSYKGIRSPCWLEAIWLCNLKSLSLINCEGLKSLPPLGQLPGLKFLKIIGMHAVKRVGCEFYGHGTVRGFPSLEHIQFVNMSKWVEWSEIEDSQMFPCLRELKIKNCPKLLKLPTFPPNLMNISIRDVGPIHNLDFCPLSSPLQTLLSLTICSSTMLLDDYLHCHHFRDVEVLNLDMCHQGTLSAVEFREFTSIQRLRVSFCPNLLESMMTEKESCCSILPSSLVYLDILQCGITDESLSKWMQNLTSLCTLEIGGCPFIISLPSRNVLCHLTALRQMHIADCKELISLAGLHAVSSLRTLRIVGCPKLLSSSMIQGVEDNCNSILPSSLVRLAIESCGLVDISLSNCLRNLTSLATLKIKGCLQITSLPSAQVLCHLTALQQVSIGECPLLTSLAGLHELSSLRTLRIFLCPTLLESMTPGEGDSCGILPSSLEYLEINSCGIIDESLSRCLQNLISLSTLNIEGCHGITSLPPANVLRHLTLLQKLHVEDCKELSSAAAGLSALVSLRDLNIERCPKLDSMALLHDVKNLSSLKELNVMDGSEIQLLPDDGLPASLEYFSLLGCHPELKAQLRKKKGPEWDKIAHISQIFY